MDKGESSFQILTYSLFSTDVAPYSLKVSDIFFFSFLLHSFISCFLYKLLVPPYIDDVVKEHGIHPLFYHVFNCCCCRDILSFLDR